MELRQRRRPGAVHLIQRAPEPAASDAPQAPQAARKPARPAGHPAAERRCPGRVAPRARLGRRGAAAPHARKAVGASAEARRQIQRHGRDGAPPRREAPARAPRERPRSAGKAVPRLRFTRDQRGLRAHLPRSHDRPPGEGAHPHPLLVPLAPVTSRVGRAALDQEAITGDRRGQSRRSRSTGPTILEARPPEPEAEGWRARRGRPVPAIANATEPGSRAALPPASPATSRPENPAGPSPAGRLMPTPSERAVDLDEAAIRTAAWNGVSLEPSAASECWGGGPVARPGAVRRSARADLGPGHRTLRSRDELRGLAERLNPDAWVTADEVGSGLEEFERVLETVRQRLGPPSAPAAPEDWRESPAGSQPARQARIRSGPANGQPARAGDAEDWIGPTRCRGDRRTRATAGHRSMSGVRWTAIVRARALYFKSHMHIRVPVLRAWRSRWALCGQPGGAGRASTTPGTARGGSLPRGRAAPPGQEGQPHVPGRHRPRDD